VESKELDFAYGSPTRGFRHYRSYKKQIIKGIEFMTREKGRKKKKRRLIDYLNLSEGVSLRARGEGREFGEI